MKTHVNPVSQVIKATFRSCVSLFTMLGAVWVVVGIVSELLDGMVGWTSARTKNNTFDQLNSASEKSEKVPTFQPGSNSRVHFIILDAGSNSLQYRRSSNLICFKLWTICVSKLLSSSLPMSFSIYHVHSFIFYVFKWTLFVYVTDWRQTWLAIDVSFSKLKKN